MELCGKMHMEFANILVEYEVAVEKLVVGKFIEIVDVSKNENIFFLMVKNVTMKFFKLVFF